LVLFLVFIANAARGAEQVQAPVFKEGDFWKFKVVEKRVPGFSLASESPNGIYILRCINDQIEVRKLVDDKEVRSGQRGQILNLLGLHARLVSNRIVNSNMLRFPFYIGKEWQYSYKDRATFTVKFEIVSEQSVATQGGNFRAFRIERSNQWAQASDVWGSGVHATRGTYFYSPEAKVIVKYDSGNDDGYELHIELLEFKPAQ